MRQTRHNKISKIAMLLIALMILSLPLLGAFIQPNQAASVAKVWLQQGPAALRNTPEFSKIIAIKDGVMSQAQEQYNIADSSLPAMYMLFTNEGHFAIVSADDNSVPVLGYSAETRSIPNTVSPEFMWWVSEYEQQINDIRDRKLIITDNQNKWSELLSGSFPYDTRNTRAISPLLSTLWDQAWPYNELCPLDANGPGGRAYAGCVATAMGQVMKYWEHPTMGTGSYSYYAAPYGYQSANFGTTTYLWDQMPNTISGSNIPIATLLKHTGVSVSMQYAGDGSGAYSIDVPGAMMNYFSYPSAAYRPRTSFTEPNWIQLIKYQLDDGSPVYYSGSDPEGGHAWVCDGYDSQDYFHMNFGWGGSYNGNFLVGAINSGNGNFNSNQAVVINTLPANYNMNNAKIKMAIPPVATVGTYFNVDVRTSPILGSWNVNHFEFVITYDHSNVVYNSFSTTNSIGANGTFTVTEIEPGFISVVWNGTQSLLGPGSLIQFNFTPLDAGDYLFDIGDMKYNTTNITNTEFVFMSVEAPVATLAQSAITMTNVQNLTYQAIGTTEMRTTYILPSWNVDQYSFNLTYIPTKLEFVGVEVDGTLSAGSTPNAVVNTPGNVTVTCTLPANISGEGSLLKLKFKAIGNTSNLSITQVTPSNFTYNTTQLSTVSGCTYRLAGYTSNEDEVAVIAPTLEIYPNPFSSSTAFKFNSKSAAPVTFNVYNVKGQLIRQYANNDAKASELVWDGKDARGNHVAGGIYLVRWEQGKDKGSAKLLILK